MLSSPFDIKNAMKVLRYRSSSNVLKLEQVDQGSCVQAIPSGFVKRNYYLSQFNN